MLKTKYESLSKEEKLQVREKFYQTENGKNLKFRFTRILIVSVLLLLYSVCLFVESIVKKGSIWGYISAITLFLFSILFLISRHRIQKNKINEFLVKQKIK